MKKHRVLCLCAAIMFPQLVLANLPFANDSFGKLEGTLSFCSKLNPPGAAKYRELGKILVQGVPEKELAEARQTAEYKDSMRVSVLNSLKYLKTRLLRHASLL